jgi:1-acyl-sn-glycerol-3-phosphate acyltransferase
MKLLGWECEPVPAVATPTGRACNARTGPLILKAARGLYEYFWMFLGFLYIGAVGLIYSTVCSILRVVLHGMPSALGARRVTGLLLRIFFRMLCASGVLRVDLSALQTLRGRCVIIAPNHPSMLDALFVISHVPEVGCIMKAPIWDNPVLGGAARLMDYIRNDAPVSMIRQAAAELKAGVPLLVFPEGTRTRRKPVNAFKGGFALIAKRANVPVQTVFIETDNPFLSKGWPFLKKPIFPLVYRVRLGQAFKVEGNVHTFVKRLEQYYRDELSVAPATRTVAQSATAARPGAAA